MKPLIVITVITWGIPVATKVQAFLISKQFFHEKVFDESISTIYVILRIYISGQQPPEATNEIRDHKYDYN
jgi:hypothetical protein